jgi:hypothetical protein
VDRVFLDASVLFAAAYRARAGVRCLWSLTDVELVTTSYVRREVESNLLEVDEHGRPKEPEQVRIEKLDRFLALLRSVQIVADPADRPLPDGVELPEKDRPILLAAIACHRLSGNASSNGRQASLRCSLWQNNRRGPRPAARSIPQGSLSGQLSGQDAETLPPLTSTQQPINRLLLCRLFRQSSRTISRARRLIRGLEPFFYTGVAVIVNEQLSGGGLSHEGRQAAGVGRQILRRVASAFR